MTIQRQIYPTRLLPSLLSPTFSKIIKHISVFVVPISGRIFRRGMPYEPHLAEFGALKKRAACIALRLHICTQHADNTDELSDLAHAWQVPVPHTSKPALAFTAKTVHHKIGCVDSAAAWALLQRVETGKVL